MLTRRFLPAFALFAMTCVAAPKIKVVLLDGESGGPYHDWRKTTPVLKQELEETGLFAVDVVTAPPAGGDFSPFKPEWGKYKVVVLNYDAPDERWPDSLKASFEQYVSKGGGVVSVHAADNAFPKWKAYNQMIGVGGWRGRDEKSGPMFYIEDGAVKRDDSPGPAGYHGPRKPFKIDMIGKHPITDGLPRTWIHAVDELYAKMRGPGENMTIVAAAYSEPSNKGTGRNEPMFMVLKYGKGRIFHTTLGHDVAALNCVGFATTYQRATEWAATGKVTQKVPANFPTADKESVRAEPVPPTR